MMEFFSMSEALPSLFSIRSRRNFVVKISYILGYVFTSSLSHSKYISLVSCIFLLDASSCSSLSLSYSISLSVTLLQILSMLGLSGLSIYSFHLSGKSSLESIMIISLGPEASKKIYFQISCLLLLKTTSDQHFTGQRRFGIIS